MKGNCMSIVRTRKVLPLSAPQRLPARWVWILERSAGIGIFVGWSNSPTLGIVAGIATLTALHLVVE
jgi:hypothetical protein